MNCRSLVVVLCASLGLAGCSDGGETEPADQPCGSTAVDASGCDVVLSASGEDDSNDVQTALIDAQSGNHVCFCPGQYSFEKELSLTVTDVTVRGLGESRDDVVLDFAAQTVGDDGVTVTSDGFTIEHLSVKNTPGNGVVVSGADDVTFRDIKVSWDAGSVTENGAYAVYPTGSRRVIVEDSEVVGASDAGIYVGQCEQAIVRNNVVRGNVAGIEVENTLDAEVVGNEAYDNSAGILVFVLPNLEVKEGKRCKVHGNNVYENNRKNFAEMGTVVRSVPAGTGMLLLAADETEVHDNVITDNISTAVLLVSYETLAQLSGVMLDPETDPYLESTYIHDNEMSGNGGEPKNALGLLAIVPLEDVLWDGLEATTGSADLCLGSSPPSFRNFAGVDGIADSNLHSTDTTPHQCEGTTQSAVSW